MIHVCARSGTTVQKVRRCRQCRARRRHVVTYYEWYGPEVVCCHCGARTSAGFLRRARARDAKVAAAAAALWASLPGTKQAIAHEGQR